MSIAEQGTSKINLRSAEKSDLPAVNGVIERAVNTWNLPERVKRLAMSTYLYTEYDLQHLHIVLAENITNGVVGVAAWEAAAVRDCPLEKRGLLLHGLYVDPGHQHRGTGSRLLSSAATAAREQGYDGLLVKAQADAEGFFKSQGLRQLAITDASRDYPNRYWMDTSP